MSNRAALNEGFKKAKEQIYGKLFDGMAQACNDFIDDAEEMREYEHFTGNTGTSYTCGLYLDGALSYMTSSGDKMQPPVHSKIKQGQTLHLTHPYEGEPRSRKGYVPIVYDKSGEETAKEILSSTDTDHKGIYMKMTTGTEYSNFLESAFHLNVLSATADPMNVKEIVENNLKRKI